MGKVSDFFNKLKKVNHIEIIACGVILAVVLVIYFSCVSCSSTEKTQKTSVDLSGADYCTSMQVQLEKIVSEINGVGNASVVINWDRSVTTSILGTDSENPKATGALVVCDGGDQTKVKLDVIYAVSTLLDLERDKIIVYKKSN